MRRRRDTLEALWWMTVMLVGLPVGLLHVPGRPTRPRHLPSHDQLVQLLQQPLTQRTTMAGMVVIGWMLWVILLGAVMRDLVRWTVARVRQLPRLRLPGPVQSLSATVLGAVAISSTTAGSAHAVHSRPAPTSTGPDKLLRLGAANEPGTVIVTPSMETTRAAPVAVAGLTATVVTSTVPDLVAPTDPPTAPRTATVSVSQMTSATQPHTAKPFPGRSGTSVTPMRLAAQTQHITVMAAGQAHSYTVHRGDNLSHIAADWLGDPNRWPEIYHLNRGRHFPEVGGTLTNPNLIYPGWVLALPDDARPPGPNPPAPAPNPTPSAAAPPAPAPAAPAPSQPATPPRAPAAPSTPSMGPLPSASASASVAASTRASAVPSRSGSASPLPSPRASDTAGSGSDRQPPSANRPDTGIRLPGGWVPIPLATALIAAAGLVWLRRRHHYVPSTLAAPVLSDPDLQPLPPAITMLRRGVRRQTPEPLPAPAESPRAMGEATDLTEGGAEQLPATGHTRTGQLPPIGPSGPDLVGLDTPLPTGGLGLAGDGAPAAARAMLVAALSSGSPQDPDARGQVVVPIDALTTLLGVDAIDLAPTPRLTVTANLGEALTRLEQLLIERRRTLQDEEADDLASMRAADPMHPPMPPVLLLAEVPGPGERARLTTTLHLGIPVQINAVLLGDWPRGDTVDVDTQGYTGNDDGDRLAVLDTTTALQLLQMLAEAHTGQGSTPPTSDPAAASNMDDRDPARIPHDVPAVLDLPELAIPRVDPQTQVSAGKVAAPSTAASHDAQDELPIHPAADHPRVSIRVLGRPALVTTGPPKQELRRRAQELLVYLAVHRAGANLPDIKEAFWPDASNRRAGERLQTEVGDLRGRIRNAYHTNHEADPGSDKEEPIQPVINTGGRYHLNPDLLDIDWWTVQDALAAATTDTAHRVEHLRRAVDAFHGPLAHGHSYDWLPDVAEHVRRQGILAYTQLAQLVADTNPAEAAGLLDQATVLDPINEGLARAAMRAHARLRDPDAVRAQLHRIRTALDEIDLEPDEQTIALAADLLQQITAASGKPPRPRQQPPQP